MRFAATDFIETIQSLKAFRLGQFPERGPIRFPAVGQVNHFDRSQFAEHRVQLAMQIALQLAAKMFGELRLIGKANHHLKRIGNFRFGIEPLMREFRSP